jgi:hypothetical protein
MINEMVYQGRDNVNQLTLTEDGLPVNLSAATRMLLQFDGSDVEADSALSNEYIDWDAQGRVNLRLGSLPIIPSKYPATLIVYDADHPEGQVVFHARETKVIFWFVPADHN